PFVIVHRQAVGTAASKNTNKTPKEAYMWDFNFSQALKLMLKTSPFILLRMAIYFGITLAYLIATGIGAGIGYGVTAFGDKPGSGALWGAFIGFGGISGLLYWAREYILYLVKAAHIAVL